ncbi:hypothetical protein ACHQM5_003359 [Ranunculus cassubicifolius]
MEAIESSRTSSSSIKDDELEAMELLDDYWFFQNLLNKKNRMFRSASDPYPSNNNMDEVFAQIKNESSSNRVEENGSIYQNLQRTPSLPVTIGRDARVEEKEVTSRPNKLSRQGSLCSPNVLPPIRVSKTCTTVSPGIPKHLTRRQSLGESSVNKEGKLRPRRTKDLNRSFSQNLTKSLNQLEIDDGKRYPYGQKEMLHRSLSRIKNPRSPTELESEEVQGFKDLGFYFDKIDLNPCVADIIPGLQSKKLDTWHEEKVRRPYLSEAWLVHNPTPSIPEWIDPGSVGDMKKHLKYWARAVASNMRQEC